MTSSTLNFGLLGRCACGACGKRRARFGNEPICSKCLPERCGYLHVTDWTRDLVVGTLTAAQRRARRELLVR
jgi:hypothetical protein